MMGLATLAIEEQFTVAEVSEMLKVSERTIRRWIKSGKLRVTKISGRGPKATEYRISISALEDIGFKREDKGLA